MKVHFIPVILLNQKCLIKVYETDTNITYEILDVYGEVDDYININVSEDTVFYYINRYLNRNETNHLQSKQIS